LLTSGKGMGEKKSNTGNEESDFEINKMLVSSEFKKLVELNTATPEETEELIEELSSYIENFDKDLEFNKALVYREIKKLFQASAIKNYSYLPYTEQSPNNLPQLEIWKLLYSENFELLKKYNLTSRENIFIEFSKRIDLLQNLVKSPYESNIESKDFGNHFSSALIYIRCMTRTSQIDENLGKRNLSYSMLKELESLVEGLINNKKPLFERNICAFLINYERITLLNSDGAYLRSLLHTKSLKSLGHDDLLPQNVTRYGYCHPCLCDPEGFKRMITDYTHLLAGMNPRRHMFRENDFAYLGDSKTLHHLARGIILFNRLLIHKTSVDDRSLKARYRITKNKMLFENYVLFSKGWPDLYPHSVSMAKENLRPLCLDKIPEIETATGSYSLTQLRNNAIEGLSSGNGKVDVKSLPELFNRCVLILGDLSINNPLAAYEPKPKVLDKDSDNVTVKNKDPEKIAVKKALPNFFKMSLLNCKELKSESNTRTWEDLSQKIAGNINRLISYSDMLFLNQFKVTKGERMRFVRYGPYSSDSGELSWMNAQQSDAEEQSESIFDFQQFLQQSYRISKNAKTTKMGRINLMSRMIKSISDILFEHTHEQKEGWQFGWKGKWYTNQPILLSKATSKMPISLHVYHAMERLSFLHKRIEICNDLTEQVNMFEHYRQPIRDILYNLEQQIGVELCHLELIRNYPAFVNSISESNSEKKAMARQQGSDDFVLFDSVKDVFQETGTPAQLLSNIQNELWNGIDSKINPDWLAEMMEKIMLNPEFTHRNIEYVSRQSTMWSDIPVEPAK
jgi:hypothetical protein